MKNGQAYLVLSLLVLLIIFLPKNHTSKNKEAVLHIVPEGTFILVLSPHLDDAALSLGGFLFENKGKVNVETFFIKSNGSKMRTFWDRISGFKDSNESVEMRTKENIEALQLSSTTITDFTLDDAQYRVNADYPKIINEIVFDVELQISKHEDKNIFIYGPADFGHGLTNPDHLLLHRAFLQMAEKYRDNKNISFFIYEDFPYIKKFLVSGRGDLLEFLQAESNRKLSEEVIDLTTQSLNSKIEALGKYSSQLKAFGALGEDLINESKTFTQNRSEFGPSEVVYRVNP